MNETKTLENIRRAELARAHLARDLTTVVRTGQRLVRRGKSALRKAVPLTIALAALGLMIAAAIAPRRRRGFPERRRPLFGELVRRAAFSAIGVLAGRLARRVPLPSPSRSAEPRTRLLRRADVDPMLPEARRERERPGART